MCYNQIKRHQKGLKMNEKHKLKKALVELRGLLAEGAGKFKNTQIYQGKSLDWKPAEDELTKAEIIGFQLEAIIILIKEIEAISTDEVEKIDKPGLRLTKIRESLELTNWTDHTNEELAAALVDSGEFTIFKEEPEYEVAKYRIAEIFAAWRQGFGQMMDYILDADWTNEIL